MANSDESEIRKLRGAWLRSPETPQKRKQREETAKSLKNSKAKRTK